jgi:hypothetical protein
MACTLSNSGITTGLVIRAAQVSQSIDAFTKAKAYDITLSGSLVVTGSVAFSSSDAFDFTVQGIPNVSQTNVLSYNNITGTIGYVAASSFVPQPSVSPYETGSRCDIKPLEGSNVTGNCFFSNIGGGEENKIDSIYSVIGGGIKNLASNNCSFIGGGCLNTSSGDFSFVVGGYCNQSTNNYSVIIGGQENISSANGSFIGAGTYNISNGLYTTIINGIRQTASADYSFIGGGSNNEVKNNQNDHASITSGQDNTIESNGSYSTIIGGLQNMVCHCQSFIIGSCITSSAICTTHVNNLNVGCTTQMQLRDPIGTGQAGMLVACDVGGGVAELYFHDGTIYKKVCLVP